MYIFSHKAVIVDPNYKDPTQPWPRTVHFKPKTRHTKQIRNCIYKESSIIIPILTKCRRVKVFLRRIVRSSPVGISTFELRHAHNPLKDTPQTLQLYSGDGA